MLNPVYTFELQNQGSGWNVNSDLQFLSNALCFCASTTTLRDEVEAADLVIFSVSRLYAVILIYLEHLKKTVDVHSDAYL